MHVSTRTCYIHHKRGVTEVWHMAHFWVSCGRCTMPGSPIGPFVGSSWRRQTTLQVEMFNMSDRVALNGRSTRDERACDRNMCEPFLNHARARLVP